MQVNNKAPTLTVVEGTTRNINWQIGTRMPTYYITLVSSDSPISDSLSTGGMLAPSIAQQSGLAYSFRHGNPRNLRSLSPCGRGAWHNADRHGDHRLGQ